MKASDRALCAVYAAIAVIALFATWSQNLAFLATPDNGGIAGFFRASYANPAAASLANDVLLYALAGCIFIVVESRRLNIRFPILYILLAVTIAISVAFPLFLIARQRKLAAWPANSA